MGHRWKRLLKPIKNLEKKNSILTSPGPQGPCRRVPRDPAEGSPGTSENRLLSNEAKGAMWGVA